MSVFGQIKKTAQRLFLPKRFHQPPFPVNYQPMSAVEDYTLRGYVHQTILDKPSFRTLYTTLQEANALKLKGNSHWEEKSPGYFLLRPKLSDYAPLFVDFLFENEVPQLIYQTTGQILVLVDVTYIHHRPPIENGWHRDTYIYNGKSVGPLPPIFKLIYYPRFEAPAKPQLKIIPGSHRRMYFDRVTDESQICRRDTQTIFSDNQRFVFFDSTLLHAVCPETKPEGSYRLHFQFARRSQLDGRYPDGAQFQNEYLERLRSIELH